MVIAVVGEYGIAGYRRLVETVRVMRPNDEVLDLGRHEAEVSSWKAAMDRRSTDIINAQVVVVSRNFKERYEGRRDLHYAMQIGKELVFDNGNEEEIGWELERTTLRQS